MPKLYDLTYRDHLIDKNYSKGRSKKIRRIVIHHNAGHGADPYKTWQTREASAHFQVWSDGDVDRIVRERDTAWHAHEANDDSIGIEHENASGGDLADRGWPIDARAISKSAKLVGYLCAAHGLGAPKLGRNVFTHGQIESDGVGVDSGTACPGPFFIKRLKAKDSTYFEAANQYYKHARGGNAVTAPVKTVVNKIKPKKSVDTVAREVIAGKWGNGAERDARLKRAGYNAAKVQARVNQLV